MKTSETLALNNTASNNVGNSSINDYVRNANHDFMTNVSQISNILKILKNRKSAGNYGIIINI